MGGFNKKPVYVGYFSMALIISLFVSLCVSLFHLEMTTNRFLESSVVITDSEGHATAFFVSPNLLLTAKHVPDTNDMYIKLDDGTELVILERWDDPNNDFSLIEVDHHSEDYIHIPSSPIDLEYGSSIYWYGTPLDIRAYDQYREGNIIIQEGVSIPGWWEDVIISTGYSFPGDSGSPVFFKHDLIGVLVGSEGYYSLTLIEPIDDLSLELRDRIFVSLSGE